MTTTGNIYANAYDQAFSGNINWASDSIKVALVTSSYTPNLATDKYWSTPQADEVSGTGYTAGGVALGTKTHVVTAANSWGTTRANSTAYTYGQLIIPTSANGYLYRVVTAGTSGSSPPSFPTTVGQTVTDGSAELLCAGEEVIVWSSAGASWTGLSATFEYAVLYDAQSGSASTDPLIAVINLGSTVLSGANWTLNPDSSLGWFSTTPA